METTFILTEECLEFEQKSTGRNLGQFFLEHSVEIDVTVNVSGGQEAKLDGPPENCQPGYGPDVELEKAVLRGDMILMNTDMVAIIYPPGYDITKWLSAAACKRIERGIDLPTPSRRYRTAA